MQAAKTQWRHELKYLCAEAQLFALEQRLGAIMDTDRHAEQGSYTVSSLYFDDYHDSSAWENDRGIDRRHKYRIRTYGSTTNLLNLEKKSKLAGMCAKRSVRLTQAEYTALVEGNPNALCNISTKPLLREFFIEIALRAYSPRVIVEYQRKAFVDLATNVRITIDRHIHASWETDRFLSGERLDVPLLNVNESLLEVKYDHILPPHITQVIESGDIQRSRFSKYYLARQVLKQYRG